MDLMSERAQGIHKRQMYSHWLNEWMVFKSSEVAEDGACTYHLISREVEAVGEAVQGQPENLSQ